MAHVLVVGAGIFGATAALELLRRGHEVTILDIGTPPHPLAESTDISKVVRLDYGGDVFYTAWMERALEAWRDWNRRWSAPLFHECGVLFMSRESMAPGGFEHDSFALLSSRGHRLERMDAGAVGQRFPAWNSSRYLDGYFNPQGGWAESGRVVAQLLDEARAQGVELVANQGVVRILEHAGQAQGVVTASAETVRADAVVVTAGAWVPEIISELRGHIEGVGQAVFHLAPRSSEPFEASRFPVFGADIAKTGWYGFPVWRGVVKLANHGPGHPVDLGLAERVVPPEAELALRAMLTTDFPLLASAPLASSRLCVYSDTRDQNFWIAPHPTISRLVVATGGSGHAFKFAPVLGPLIADALDGRIEPRFAWRAAAPPAGAEAARRRS